MISVHENHNVGEDASVILDFVYYGLDLVRGVVDLRRPDLLCPALTKLEAVAARKDVPP